MIALTFADGLVATFATSVIAVQPTINRVFAAGGSAEIHEPWRNTAGAPLIIRTPAGEKSYPAEDTGLPIHALEALAVQRAVPGGCEAPQMTWADSRGLARTIDALRHAAGVRWAGE